MGNNCEFAFPPGPYSALHNGRPLWSAKVNGEPHSGAQSALAGGNWEQLRIQFSPWGPILRFIMGAHYGAQK